MSVPDKIVLPSRRLEPALVELLRALQIGDPIRITQTVRVGAKTWPAEATGTFRGVSYLSTGLTTERVEADDIVVPTVHFTKASGELTSICLDELTKLARG